MGISAILGIGKQVYKVGKTVLKATPELTFGTSADKVGKVLRQSYTSGASAAETARAGFKAIEKASKGNFISRMFKNIKTLVPDIARYTKAGIRLAGKNGTNKFTGALKGLGKGIGKKLPFVFAAAMVLTEIPNIVKATKEKGIFQGIKETIKPVVRLAGAGIGSAIGSAVAPGFGSLIGWVAGEWLAGKIVGKSYSEEQADKEQIIAEYMQTQQQVQAQPQIAMQPALNPYTFGTTPAFTGNDPYGMTNPFTYNQDPYADDIMMQQLNFRA